MVKIEKVYEDLELAAKKRGRLHRAIREDVEFALGKQWKEEDKRKLEDRGVLALTVNQIKPMVKIITGIERQSRSDYIAFPEGQEDEVVGEVVTRLLKNVVKRSKLERKQSEMFKEGILGGECHIEPYIDYTHDLINGEMKFRKISASRMFYLDGEEYDLSDRPFVIKVSCDLSKDDLLEMFPDGEKKLESVSHAKVDFKNLHEVKEHIQKLDYELNDETRLRDDEKEDGYDLIEYYYKKPKSVYYVLNAQTGQVDQFDSKSDADQHAESTDGEVVHKKVPEIRLKQVVGDQEFSDDVCWSYPRWRGYPFFPFYAEKMNVDIDEFELTIQGVVRSLKDLQLELNKSRTAELTHLNQTANSGYGFPKDALDDKAKAAMKQFGSAPGFFFEYDSSKTGGAVSPETFRIRPAPLPQGHMALSQERINDIKQASGINPDLLANDSESQSGRAILLKQRQGLVMIQEMLDNYGETKELLGRFILTQLGEIYTVESALRVLGEGFLQENFSRPQVDAQGNIVTDDRGQQVEAVDPKEMTLILNKILNDADVGKYDVSIGEGAYSETTRMANHATIMDMIQAQLLPPLPDIVELAVDASNLPESHKKKITSAIQNVQPTG